MLHLLRVHFQSGVSLVDLIRAVKSKRLPSLKLIDIAGRFPENVEMDWTGAGVDELMLECKSAEVEVAINGRPVRTVGDLFGAVLAHARGA